MSINEVSPTRSFRLFITNGRGRIDSVAQEIVAYSDDDAIAKATEMVGDVSFELWDRPRRVMTAGRGERDINRPGD